MLWYRKSLKICEELWFATAGFWKHLSLLFAMIFESQNSPLLCSGLYELGDKDLVYVVSLSATKACNNIGNIVSFRWTKQAPCT
jgi:hypothetical protein